MSKHVYKFSFAGPGDVGAEMLESEIQNPRKRRKGARQSPVALTQGVEMQHSLELLGHKDAVTSTIWAESNAIYSGSMDHSVRSSYPLATHLLTLSHTNQVAENAIDFNGQAQETQELS